MDGRLPRWCEDTCAVCPAQELGPGAFDVVARPGREFAYRPGTGWRVGPDGTAVCAPVPGWAAAGPVRVRW